MEGKQEEMEGVGEWGLEASDRPEAEMVRAGAVAGKVMRDLKAGKEFMVKSILVLLLPLNFTSSKISYFFSVLVLSHFSCV